jgi:hypothetical protein
MVKWLPPNGFTGKVHHMDARIGISLLLAEDAKGVPAWI